jgi:hypothetical protein
LEYNTLLPEFNFRNTFLFFPNPTLMAANHFQARTLQLLRWITLLQTAIVLWSLTMVLKNKREADESRREVYFWVGIVVACLFLMSSLSAWFWETVPGLPQIQFSTRWLSFLTLASSLVTGFGLSAYPTGTSKWLKLSHFTLCVVALFFSVVIVFGGCFLGDEEEKLAAVSRYNAPEYNPKSMPNWKQRVIEVRDPPFTLIQGRAQVRVEQFQAHLRRFSVSAESPVQLRLRLFDYPGWKLTANGVRMNPTIDPMTGGIIVDLSPGAHDLLIEFESTWWRRMSLVVSLLVVSSLLGSLVWICLSKRSSLITADS